MNLNMLLDVHLFDQGYSWMDDEQEIGHMSNVKVNIAFYWALLLL